MVENLEIWLRRWIDIRLKEHFGPDCFDACQNGNRIIRKSTVDRLRKRVHAEPERYSREIDAIMLDEAIAIVCHPQCFAIFRQTLTKVFPEAGHNTIKALMDRLVPTRHCLYHANEISLTDAFRLLAFSQEIVDAIKEEFKTRNMERAFNVPTLVKVADSYGNAWHHGQNEYPHGTVYPGDQITIYAEVDPSFPKDSYEILWWRRWWQGSPHHSGSEFTYEFQISDVGQLFVIWCRVRQKKAWHRHEGYDDQIKIRFTVLPPPEV